MRASFDSLPVLTLLSLLASTGCSKECKDHVETRTLSAGWIAANEASIDEYARYRGQNGTFDAGVLVEIDGSFIDPSENKAWPVDAYTGQTVDPATCVHFDETGRFCIASCQDACHADNFASSDCRSERNDAASLVGVECIAHLPEGNGCPGAGSGGMGAMWQGASDLSFKSGRDGG